MTARIFVLTLLLACAAPVLAQRLYLFDVDDFLDPRDLGATIDGRTFTGGGRLDITRAMIGVSSSHVQLSDAIEAPAALLHLSRTVYDSNRQINMKLLALQGIGDDDPNRRLPRFRGSFQLARYSPVMVTPEPTELAKASDAEMLPIEIATSRDQVSLTVSESSRRGGKFDVELTGDMGFKVLGGVYGGFSYSLSRVSGENAPPLTNSLVYFYRYARPLGQRVSLQLIGSLGGQYSDKLRGIGRIHAQAMFPFADTRRNLHLALGTAYFHDGENWRRVREIAVFFDTALFIRNGASKQ
jgi:hypothetical protein